MERVRLANGKDLVIFSKKDLKQAYKTINSDSFPKNMEVSFYDDVNDKQTMVYEKNTDFIQLIWR